MAWQHNPFSQFKTKLSQPRASLRPSRQGSYDSLSALEAQSAASISTTPSGSRRPGAAHSQAHGFNARAVAKVQHQNISGLDTWLWIHGFDTHKQRCSIRLHISATPAQPNPSVSADVSSAHACAANLQQHSISSLCKRM